MMDQLPVDAQVAQAADRIASAFRASYLAQSKAPPAGKLSSALASIEGAILTLQQRLHMADAVAGEGLRTLPEYQQASLNMLFDLANLLAIVREAEARLVDQRAPRNHAQHQATAAVIELCRRHAIPVSKGNDGIAAQILGYVFRAGGYHISEPRKWLAQIANKLPCSSEQVANTLAFAESQPDTERTHP